VALRTEHISQARKKGLIDLLENKSTEQLNLKEEEEKIKKIKRGCDSPAVSQCLFTLH